MLSRLVITFLPRSKCLLISWLQSPSAVILEPKIIKSPTVSTVTPSICHEVMGTVEVRNRFKGLNLRECLMNYGMRFVTLYRRQGSRPSPWKRKAKKAKWLSGEALQIAVKKEKLKAKEKRKDIPIGMQSSKNSKERRESLPQ